MCTDVSTAGEEVIMEEELVAFNILAS